MFGIKDSESFVKLIKVLSKSLLGIIAVFAFILYGFGEFVDNMKEESSKMTLYLIILSAFILLMLIFVWLVAKHSDKLFKDYEIRQYLNKADKSKLTNAPALKEANAKHSLLWVDDQPENNLYEKLAFEAEGIKVDLALTTDNALTMLQNSKYSAIISDIKREEGEQEGYVLLNKIRESKNETPFFIYADKNEPEQKAMAKSKGAQGMTNQAQELYQMVMKEAH